MEQRVCTYCGNPLEPGTGRLFVKRDGTSYYFDSKRCRVGLLELKRVPRNVKWTKHYPRGGGAHAEEELAKEVASRAAEMAEHDEEVAQEAAEHGVSAPEEKPPAAKEKKKAAPKKKSDKSEAS